MSAPDRAAGPELEARVGVLEGRLADVEMVLNGLLDAGATEGPVRPNPLEEARRRFQDRIRAREREGGGGL